MNYELSWAIGRVRERELAESEREGDGRLKATGNGSGNITNTRDSTVSGNQRSPLASTETMDFNVQCINLSCLKVPIRGRELLRTVRELLERGAGAVHEGKLHKEKLVKQLKEYSIEGATYTMEIH